MNDKKLPDHYNCSSLEEWEEWLLKNHLKQKELWLRIRKVGSAKPGVFLADAVTAAIRFGWIDGKVISADRDSFLLRFTPRKPDSVWSLINKRRAEKLMEEGRMTVAGLKSVEAARSSGMWEIAYSSKEEVWIPLDLREALKAEEKALAAFEGWSASDRLQGVYWIGQSRTKETRTKRIAAVVRCAALGKSVAEAGKVLKELNNG